MSDVPEFELCDEIYPCPLCDSDEAARDREDGITPRRLWRHMPLGRGAARPPHASIRPLDGSDGPQRARLQEGSNRPQRLSWLLESAQAAAPASAGRRSGRHR